MLSKLKYSLIGTKKIVLVMLVFQSFFVQAQLGAVFGYNFGFLNRESSFFAIHEYKMDTEYPEANFNMHNFLRGFNIGFRGGNENLFFEILFTNKSARSNKTNPVLVSGVPYLYKVKYRQNSVNIGLAGGVENVKFGLSVDMGVMRIMKKYDTSDEFGRTKWDNYFDQKSEPHLGISFFVSVTIGAMEIRPYYHRSAEYDDFGYGTSFNFLGDNMGIAINLFLGKEY